MYVVLAFKFCNAIYLNNRAILVELVVVVVHTAYIHTYIHTCTLVGPMCCSETAYTATEVAQCNNAASYTPDVVVSSCSVTQPKQHLCHCPTYILTYIHTCIYIQGMYILPMCGLDPGKCRHDSSRK